jgi:hypothetical protein
MAVVIEILVPAATQEDMGRVDAGVGEAMMQTGGPPAGLMVHFVRPAGHGFLICDVWRSEAEVRSFLERVLLPAISEAGLHAGEPEVWPVWNFARPRGHDRPAPLRTVTRLVPHHRFGGVRRAMTCCFAGGRGRGGH